jgi:aminopeptidase N
MRHRAQATMRRVTLAAAFGAPLALLDTYPKNPNVDALNYAFRIEVSDSSDAIRGELTLDVRVLSATVRSLRLDLANATPERSGKGMQVQAVLRDGAAVPFTHANDELLIPLPPIASPPQRLRVVVRYAGTPATGLLIGRNKHGDRTFFSDNWPTRARHWLPTIDHPSDKATSEFLVTAPSHYQVVSNGLPVEATDLLGNRRLTHWRNSVPIAPWLFVLGVARFAVQHVGEFDHKPIETWVYPQDRDAGFADFASPTRDVLAFYTDYVGPYAYERLANIQASSVAGGMESASAILYNESAVTGTRSVRWRNVVIHEIAHQWFGNAVTEADWDDVWLSEGFATYFTLLFIEHAYGRDEFVRGLEASQRTVMAFAEKNPGYTIVHRNLSRMEDVTSSHTYQKGSWILHMLRGVMGNDAFQRGIRTYYQRHFNGNATTADFRRAMEEASGTDLGWFFEQWLYKPGTLRVAAQWTYDAHTKQVRITVTQTQRDGSPFAMPLDIGLYAAPDAAPTLHRVQLTAATQVFTLDAAAEPAQVRLDPNRWVLMDAAITREGKPVPP